MKEDKREREKLNFLEQMAGVFANITYGHTHESKHRGGRIQSPSARAKRKKARKAARTARKTTRPRYKRRSK